MKICTQPPFVSSAVETHGMERFSTPLEANGRGSEIQ